MEEVKKHLEEIRELLEMAINYKDIKITSEAYCKTLEIEKVLDKKISPLEKGLHQ